ncbi:proton-coupled amino acid transporter 1-like [Dendronephthya gigantea]|uniref:proton-coupled amino acid transporter 1-like n=1 Tax=Dendronephthya gigantea TaxID=151771 RepID=UPI00106C3B39|nr:proton-coupled amino acid transporter 1-like [Dendronephthya gigantea]
MPQYDESRDEEGNHLLPVLDKSLQNESSKSHNADERDGKHLLSGYQCAVLIFKFCVGAGWFSLPAAFQFSGVLVGVILVCVCGGLTIFGMQRLVTTSWEVARRNGTETAFFGDIGAACGKLLNERWEQIGRLVVDIFLLIASFSMVCAIILFVAHIWKQAFKEQNIIELEIIVWVLIVYFILLPTIFIQRPDFLAWFSLIANIFEVITIVSLMVHIFSKTSNFKVNNTVTWSKLPLTVGMVFFAFEIAPFILSVENKTRKPRQLPLVINVIMIGVSCTYVFVGSIGYVSCFPECQDSIILNLPNFWFYSVCKILMGLAGCASIILSSYVAYETFAPILKSQVPEHQFRLISLMFRTLLLTFAAAFTASIPQLGNVISLAGSFVTGTIGFLLPAVAHTLLLYNQLSRFTIITNVIFLLCGLFVLFAGVYTSIVEIVEDF